MGGVARAIAVRRGNSDACSIACSAFEDDALNRRRAFDVKSDIALCAIPVIVISVVAQENRGHFVGAASYLDKPVTLEDLADLVRQNMTDRQRAHISLPRIAVSA